jgi:hypothetical protein
LLNLEDKIDTTVFVVFLHEMLDIVQQIVSNGLPLSHGILGVEQEGGFLGGPNRSYPDGTLHPSWKDHGQLCPVAPSILDKLSTLLQVPRRQ